MQTGSFIISLDFELHWGRFDKYPPQNYYPYYEQTIAVVPKLLELFSRRGIHSTWATVGMLMAENREEWDWYSPQLLPNYQNPRCSAYHWLKNAGKVHSDALFAPNLVREIIQTPNQELASHTFSHFYTGELGSTSEAFKSDLVAAKKIAKYKFDRQLDSLVFPRNQYNDQALQSAKEAGFKTVRTNPSDWFWKNTANETLMKKLFRTGDTLVPLGKKSSFAEPELLDEDFLAIPASRLLRPYRSNSIFNSRRVIRIKEEMLFAAKNKETYHLWWHPHNFGNHPKENMRILEDLLNYYSELKDQYDMKSLSMAEYSAKFLEDSVVKKIAG